MKERDRYLKIVEWSEEDQCYIGSVPGWIGKCCHGSNEEKVYRKLCQIVDEWIDIYAEDGRPLDSAISRCIPYGFELVPQTVSLPVSSTVATPQWDSIWTWWIIDVSNRFSNTKSAFSNPSPALLRRILK